MNNYLYFMNKKINSFSISENAAAALDLLESKGFQAFLAGGCVRDLVMGKAPHDWDITTSALPEETKEVFAKAGFKTVDTGIAHGTVTAIVGGEPLEITTFRSESEYSDHRRPDSVSFVSTPEEDVKRRDFTMNALLYSPSTGIVDLVGGLEDIENGLIRAVGSPSERFAEDALRIMRALRFSSTLGFEIEEKTSDALFEHMGLLRAISEERKRVEFTKLLLGKDAKYVLFRYSRIIEVIVPNIHPMIGFDQNNPHHCYDVWMHTLEALEAVRPDPVLRLTMFFHDIEKPACHTMDSDGISHFHTHPEKSAATAEKVMKSLRFSNDEIEAVTRLIRFHDFRFPPQRKNVLNLLNRIGEDSFRLLLEVKRADLSAQSPYYIDEKRALVDSIEEVLDHVIEENACFSLRDLAVKGSDLIEEGFSPGKELGNMLSILLTAVIDEKLPNDKAVLLDYAVKNFR